MRKVLSFMLCVAMLCSLVVFTAQADSGVQIAVDDVTVFVGATVNLDLGLIGNTGMAGWKVTIDDEDGLGIFGDATFTNKTGLNIQNGNLENGILVWFGSTNYTGNSMGFLTFQIPEDAEPGVYNFTITPGEDDAQAKNDSKEAVNLIGTTFTITVVNESVITGVNVSIAAGLTIDVHVATDDPDVYTITAVDEAGKEFDTIDEYEEGFAGDYIFKLKVAPWAMDRDFTVDFTENFIFGDYDDNGTEDDTSDDTFDENPDGDFLDLSAIPETAKKIGILSYCNAVLAKGASDELKQLIADMLEYGRLAQVYNGAEAASYTLPDGLSATDLDENFGATCQTKYPEIKTSHNGTALKKFKFSTADISMGDQFVVKFTMVNNGSKTTYDKGRIVVNGTTYSMEPGMIYKYAFTPMEYAGVNFNLYGTATINDTNWGWDMTYGPLHYAAYVSKNGGDAATLQLLNAFYNYGVSAKAYAGN